MSMKFMYEIYESLPRCGPGDEGSARRAFEAMKGLPKNPYILDIGCGTGMHTIDLAKISGGKIVAIDNHQPFLDILSHEAERCGVGEHIRANNMDMLKMDFPDETFDMIWSEGALYFMGFAKGLKKCRELLKPGGFLAVSEAAFFVPDPPEAIYQYMKTEYPDMKGVKENISLIEDCGLELITHFHLPKSAWMD